jgi:hypothetical protein
MSDILIKYQSKSFWISPDFIERVSEYICQVYETNGLNTYSEGLKGIYYCCDGNRTGESIGFVNILFNEITSNTDKTAMITLLNQTKVLIQSLGTVISVVQLNQFENAKSDPVYMTEWSIPIQTSSFVNLLNLFIDLLNGTYPNSFGNVNFIGYQSIPNPNVQVI